MSAPTENPTLAVDPVSANPPTPVLPVSVEKSGFDAQRVLLEKNLKWSHILYEQNRRLSRRLLSLAIAGWVGVVLLLVGFVGLVWYILPIGTSPFLVEAHRPFEKDQIMLDSRKQDLDAVLKLLPLNETQVNQLKTILSD